VTPVEQLLVETDAPYLTPTPVPRPHERVVPDPGDTARHGSVRETDVGSLAAAIDENTTRVFGAWG
jgi:TatD DNase family protein